MSLIPTCEPAELSYRAYKEAADRVCGYSDHKETLHSRETVHCQLTGGDFYTHRP